MQRYACDIGLDVGDFDAIIDFAGSLRQAGNVRAAMLARRRHHVAPVRRVRMQRPVRPGMRLTLGLFCHLARGLSPLARGRARIIRRLGRQTELPFKFDNTRAKDRHLSGQNGNRFRLR